MDARFGIRRDLGLYDDNIALYGSKFWYYIWELPIYVMMGCIAGALGGWFIKLNIHCTAFRAKYIPASNRWRRFGEVSCVSGQTVDVPLDQTLVLFTVTYQPWQYVAYLPACLIEWWGWSMSI